ncbi:hypothetical protein VKT23_009655 [Stygiomarasmius scandens]|uniref:CCHC-type domain-containing protein n=1 Tax=Marasmiellus scandens TaxID=2682957 RepID=A0ABR1JH29_9AGAR
MSSPFSPFESNPWADDHSDSQEDTKDSPPDINQTAEQHSGIYGDTFVPPPEPLSNYSINQKADYFQLWLYAANAAEIGHLVRFDFEPPVEPEMGTGRGASTAFDSELHSYRAWRLLENQCRVFLVQKLTIDVRREVMDGTTTCKDAWLNLVREFQVKTENDTADLKARWMLMACGDKENLDKWLMRDKTIVTSILDMRDPSKLSTPSQSKDVALQVKPSHFHAQIHNSHSNTKPKDNIPSPEDIECYNCSGKGHISCNCSSPKKKCKGGFHGKGKSDGGNNGAKGKELLKESKGDTQIAPKQPTPKEKGGQANAVDELAFAYMAEPISSNELSDISSDELEDTDDNDTPPLQCVSDSEDDWSDNKDDCKGNT